MCRIIALSFCLCIGFSSYAAQPVFYWDMESDKANIFKADNTARYYAAAGISDSTAFSGKRSMRNENEWAAAMFDNPSLNDEWSPVTEGSIELYWRYLEPWNGKMLFQMTGKDPSGNEDTNEGFGLMMRGNNTGEFVCSMGWESDTSYSIAEARNRYEPVKLVNGSWYRFRLKFKNGVGISMQIDDNPPNVTNNSLGKTKCTAWHQLLIGNDTHSKGIQYIDHFRIWPVWLDSFPSIDAPTELNQYDVQPMIKEAMSPFKGSSRVFTVDGRIVNGHLIRAGATIAELNGNVRKIVSYKK